MNYTAHSRIRPTISANVNNFAQRLALVIGDTSISRFARNCQVSESLLRKYLSGSSLPGIDKLVAIAKGANVSIEWLATGQGRAAGSPASAAALHTDATPADFVVPPHFHYLVTHGDAEQMNYSRAAPVLGIDPAWLERELGVSPDVLALYTVGGDAMEPTIYAGDMVIVDRTQNRLTDDAMYLVSRDGHLTIKRLQRCFDGSILVRSDNPRYQDERIAAKDESRLTVAGRVLWRAGRT